MLTETTELTALSDGALDAELGAAIVDEDVARVEQLEAERARRGREIERQRLGDAERARRQAEANEAERAELLARLTVRLADLEAQHRADLDELERTPQSHAYPICDRAYRSGRVAFSFAHDLHGITGDRRFHRVWSVPDQIMLCGGAAGTAFMLSIRGRPPRVETPGAEDVVRLRRLWGPRPEMPSLT